MRFVGIRIPAELLLSAGVFGACVWYVLADRSRFRDLSTLLIDKTALAAGGFIVFLLPASGVYLAMYLMRVILFPAPGPGEMGRVQSESFPELWMLVVNMFRWVNLANWFTEITVQSVVLAVVLGHIRFMVDLLSYRGDLLISERDGLGAILDPTAQKLARRANNRKWAAALAPILLVPLLILSAMYWMRTYGSFPTVYAHVSTFFILNTAIVYLKTLSALLIRLAGMAACGGVSLGRVKLYIALSNLLFSLLLLGLILYTTTASLLRSLLGADAGAKLVAAATAILQGEKPSFSEVSGDSAVKSQNFIYFLVDVYEVNRRLAGFVATLAAFTRALLSSQKMLSLQVATLTDIFGPEVAGPSATPESIPADAKETVVCPICMGEYDLSKPRANRRLACGHVFHDRCLQSWIVSGKAACPLCFADVFPHDAGDPDDNADREIRGADLRLYVGHLFAIPHFFTRVMDPVRTVAATGRALRWAWRILRGQHTGPALAPAEETEQHGAEVVRPDAILVEQVRPPKPTPPLFYVPVYIAETEYETMDIEGLRRAVDASVADFLSVLEGHIAIREDPAAAGAFYGRLRLHPGRVA